MTRLFGRSGRSGMAEYIEMMSGAEYPPPAASPDEDGIDWQGKADRLAAALTRVRQALADTELRASRAEALLDRVSRARTEAEIRAHNAEAALCGRPDAAARQRDIRAKALADVAAVLEVAAQFETWIRDGEPSTMESPRRAEP